MRKNNNVCISLKDVSKVFGVETSDGKKMVALNRINLLIKQGETVGIIGPNGSGKTILLKTISGMVQPTSGEVTVKGRIVSLMNLDAGFRLDLSGRENILLNGLLVGMDKSEIDRKYAEIVKFSGIEKYLDLPLYTFSDGMKFRLAFSIAVVSECEILVIDEIFIAGDTDFQLKTLTSIKNMQKEKNITIILASHILHLLVAITSKYFYMERGSLVQVSRGDMLMKLEQQNKEWMAGVGIAQKLV
jgi:lipopolysaccharide transport system ATP-binding protein